MKLGYIYTVTSNGYENKAHVNTGDWSSAVEDERRLWQKYSTNGESVAMTLVQDGLVIAITRILGGARPDDNITTWVFVPSKIRITGSQLKQVIEEVKKLNKGGTKNVSNDSFTSNEILNTEYEEKKHQPSIRPSAGKELAGRYPTTDYSLVDILDSPYQEYYSKYKYVFLVNQKNDLKEELKDLSNEEIIEHICVLPPSPHNIQKILGPSSVTLKFKDGTAFVSPKFAKKGETIDLDAVREGFLPRSVQGKAITDEQEIEIETSDKQWRKSINPYNQISVVDSKTGTKLKPQIEIINTEYNKNEHSLPENVLDRVQVRITADGYDQYDGSVDLSRVTQQIKLKKKCEKATYTSENADGYEIRVTVEGPGAKSQNPLRGYRAYGNELTFEYDNHGKSRRRSFAWKEFWYGALAVVVLALSCWGCVILYNTFFDENTPASNVIVNESSMYHDTPNQAPKVVGKSQRERALEYLEKNKEWERDSLNKYPELEGLFEELNSYQFEKIIDRYSVLSGSERFKKVYDAAQSNIGNPITGHYCEDDVITIDR